MESTIISHAYWCTNYAKLHTSSHAYCCVALIVSLFRFHSARLLSDLLYKLNYHMDKQSAVGELFFAGLWIADNSYQDK